jgi:hypothetical protein
LGPEKPRLPQGKRTQAADRVVVRVKEDAGAGVLRDLFKLLPAGTTVVKDVDRMGRAVLQLPPGTDVARAVTDLEASPDVVYAEALFLDYGSG